MRRLVSVASQHPEWDPRESGTLIEELVPEGAVIEGKKPKSSLKMPPAWQAFMGFYVIVYYFAWTWGMHAVCPRVTIALK